MDDSEVEVGDMDVSSNGSDVGENEDTSGKPKKIDKM